jgi:Flp pilus assembly protein TadD
LARAKTPLDFWWSVGNRLEREVFMKRDIFWKWFLGILLVVVVMQGIYRERDWRNYRFYRSQGQQLLDKGKYAEAIPHLREAVRFAPSSPSPHARLGEALYHTGQLEEAITELRKASHLSDDPVYVGTYVYLGDALNKKGLRAEARTAWQKAVEEDSEEGWAKDAAEERLRKYSQ